MIHTFRLQAAGDKYIDRFLECEDVLLCGSEFESFFGLDQFVNSCTLHVSTEFKEGARVAVLRDELDPKLCGSCGVLIRESGADLCIVSQTFAVASRLGLVNCRLWVWVSDLTYAWRS